TEAGRKLSKTCERMTDEDIHAFGRRQHEARLRWEEGRQAYTHEAEPLCFRLGSASSERVALEHACGKYLFEMAADRHATLEEIEELGHRFLAVRMPSYSIGDVMLLMIGSPRAGQGFGSFRLGWRVAPPRSEGSPDASVVVHMGNILPFGRYHHFASVSDLSFNLVAHRHL